MNTYITTYGHLLKHSIDGDRYNVETIPIRPCPFCGGEVSIYTYDNSSFGYITCVNCGCTIRRDHPSIKDLVEAWNKRKGETYGKKK